MQRGRVNHIDQLDVVAYITILRCSQCYGEYLPLFSL